jgi:hypothetical protein
MPLESQMHGIEMLPGLCMLPAACMGCWLRKAAQSIPASCSTTLFLRSSGVVLAKFGIVHLALGQLRS